MRRQMRFVERRGMDDKIDTPYASTNKVSIRHGADVCGKRRLKEIQPDDLMFALAQDADETFAKVSCASGHQHAHSVCAFLPNAPNEPRAAGTAL